MGFHSTTTKASHAVMGEYHGLRITAAYSRQANPAFAALRFFTKIGHTYPHIRLISACLLTTVISFRVVHHGRQMNNTLPLLLPALPFSPVSALINDNRPSVINRTTSAVFCA